MNILISYPNSGRTWYSAMLSEMGVNVYLAHYGALHELNTMISYVYKYPDKFVNDSIILLYRDSKDHIVSNYFQMKYRFRLNLGSMSEFIRHPLYGVEKVIQYNLFWREFSSCQKKLIINYEDLQQDVYKEMIRSLQFCAVDFNDDALNQVIINNSFDNSHRRELENDIRERVWYKRTDRSNPESFKARRGIVGGYVDYLSQDDIEYIDSFVLSYDYVNKMKV